MSEDGWVGKLQIALAADTKILFRGLINGCSRSLINLITTQETSHVVMKRKASSNSSSVSNGSLLALTLSSQILFMDIINFFEE